MCTRGIARLREIRRVGIIAANVSRLKRERVAQPVSPFGWRRDMPSGRDRGHTSAAAAVGGARAIVNVVSLYVERGDGASSGRGKARAYFRDRCRRALTFALHPQPGEGEAAVRRTFPSATLIRPAVMLRFYLALINQDENTGPEDGYGVVFPDLPGCVTVGETVHSGCFRGTLRFIQLADAAQPDVRLVGKAGDDFQLAPHRLHKAAQRGQVHVRAQLQLGDRGLTDMQVRRKLVLRHRPRAAQFRQGQIPLHAVRESRDEQD